MAEKGPVAAADHPDDIPLADLSDETCIADALGNCPKPAHPLPKLGSAENAEDLEEKAALISKILELQSTLDELSQRVDKVKEESLKLRSENEVLGQYIENLMAASSIFQSTSPSAKVKN